MHPIPTTTCLPCIWIRGNLLITDTFHAGHPYPEVCGINIQAGQALFQTFLLSIISYKVQSQEHHWLHNVLSFFLFCPKNHKDNIWKNNLSWEWEVTKWVQWRNWPSEQQCHPHWQNTAWQMAIHKYLNLNHQFGKKHAKLIV